jgi:hypothetical protein
MPRTIRGSAQKSDENYNQERADQLEEWKQARDTLKFYDDKLDALRKLGFSFLTGLLAAESVVLKPDISSLVKLAVFLITLLLITAMFLLDKNYRCVEEAANTRALVLERKLNLELSETITYRYRIDGINNRVFWLYSLFILGVFVLGYFVLWPFVIPVVMLAVFSIAAFAYIKYNQSELSVFYRDRCDDWTVSPLSLNNGETIRITVNNLTKKLIGDSTVPQPITFESGEMIYRIIDEKGIEINNKKAEEEMKVYYNYTWTYKFNKDGVYRVCTGDSEIPIFTVVVYPKSRR